MPVKGRYEALKVGGGCVIRSGCELSDCCLLVKQCTGVDLCAAFAFMI